MSADPNPRPIPPLSAGQLAQLDSVLAELDETQLQWVSGYVTGRAYLPSPSAWTAAADAPKYLILYGSQTGNGEGVARRLAEAARAAGYAVELKSLAGFKPAALKKVSHASFVISTHGEGDPPDDAELFHEALLSAKAPKLAHLNFNVLALGDSSYANFCQTGREFDQRLAELGASRLSPIVECDVDFEAPAADWSQSTLAQLPPPGGAKAPTPHLHAVPATPAWTRQRPFHAEVLTVQRITGRDSSKDVVHVELSLEGSGLRYAPGDSLGVWPINPPGTLVRLLELTGLDGTAVVEVGDDTLPLNDALAHRLEITALSRPFLEAWAELSGAQALSELLADDGRAALAAFIETHQVVDVVREFPAEVDARTLAGALRRLTPRSYSIASSPNANPDEVHLTVATVRYDAFGETHWGAASTHLTDRLTEGDTVPVFLEPNTRFRLPEDGATPIIMIGPGTGVAPFRAFVEERAERGDESPAWLFFGERNFASDFLYQVEWQRHLQSGALTRLDVAFSRDQEEKVYVQDRLREHAAELARWIDDGAHLYVCGDAKRMAPDVDAALADVLAAERDLSPAAAQSALKALRQDGRYHRDVY